MTTITVRDVTRNEIVAQGKQDQNVILLEGSFYFAPDEVKRDHLIITQQIYTCAYMGTCKSWSSGTRLPMSQYVSAANPEPHKKSTGSITGAFWFMLHPRVS